MRPTLLALLAFTLLAPVAQAGEALFDRITLKTGGPADRIIIAETADEVKWRTTTGTNEGTSKRREIRSIVYAFMRGDSNWTSGMAARERGKYAEAAELFNALGNGERECEKVVGAFEEGVSWEMAGNFAEAGKAFQRVVDGFPNHPLNIDALYRLGMTLAQAKQIPEAEAIAKKFDELAKGKVGQAANVRSAAIRTALAVVAGDERSARTSIAKASFNPEGERASWLHFNLFVADAWRAQGKPKEAVPIYERMLPQLADDPAASSRIRLGIGISKAETDPQGAIVDLMSLDALPYGSPEQKCEARFHLGRLLLAAATAAEKDAATAADERRVAFIAENRRTARLLLQAAADSIANHPAKAQAAELLKTLPAEAAAAPAK